MEMQQNFSGRDYWPTNDWDTSTPDEQGIDSKILTKAIEYMYQHFPSFRTFIVIKNGYKVYEAHNHSPYENITSKILKNSLSTILNVIKKPKDTFTEQYSYCHNLRSVTKSIMSALLGIALDNNFIDSIDEAIYKLIPNNYSENIDFLKKDITIRHLITMKSGLASIDSGLNAIKMLFCDGDWVKHILNLPLGSKPGEKFLYNSANTHLLSAVISHTTRMSTLNFAKKYLFKPLGISKFFWETDSKGYNFGGGNLFLCPCDMAKVGYLYLNNGLWDDKVIISKKWVNESLQSYHDWEYGFKYGYLWYIKNEKDKVRNIEFVTYSAAGNGGQRIYIIPDLDIVIAATSRTSITGDKSYILNNVIGEFILPATKA